MTPKPSLEGVPPWRWYVVAAGAIVGVAAGFFGENSTQQGVAILGGLVLGVGMLLVLTGRRPAPAPSSGGPSAPTVWQGCIIAIGGVLLGFFSCLGAIAGTGINGTNLGPFSILAAMAIGGFVTAAGGLVLVFIRAFIRVMSGSEEQP